MKALVIGYGSMGKRRIRLLKRIDNSIEIIVVDSNPNRINEAINNGESNTIDNLDDAIKQEPDIAFVCTSPKSHADIIVKLLENKIHVFTELNLIDNKYDEIINLAKANNKVAFMSSTMLYNKNIIKIKECVSKTNKPVTYIYHVGQYLPDWHPWESYKDFFVGNKETNGIREIFAIQLPWIIDTFGEIDTVSVKSQKSTNLDIDFNDSVIVSIKNKNGNIGVLIFDIVSRKAVTSLEVIGEDLHVFWHGHYNDLEIYNFETKQLDKFDINEDIEHIEGYADNIIENQYYDEIKDFLSAVSNNSIPKYSFEKDKYTLSIINQIEESES